PSHSSYSYRGTVTLTVRTPGGKVNRFSRVVVSELTRARLCPFQGSAAAMPGISSRINFFGANGCAELLRLIPLRGTQSRSKVGASAIRAPFFLETCRDSE